MGTIGARCGGAGLSGQYGTSGRSPSGGRGRHGVGQRGDPGSGAGHWGYSRKKAQAWPQAWGNAQQVGNYGPRRLSIGLSCPKPPGVPGRQRQCGSAPRPSGPPGQTREQRTGWYVERGGNKQDPGPPLHPQPTDTARAAQDVATQHASPGTQQQEATTKCSQSGRGPQPGAFEVGSIQDTCRLEAHGLDVQGAGRMRLCTGLWVPKPAPSPAPPLSGVRATGGEHKGSLPSCRKKHHHPQQGHCVS